MLYYKTNSFWKIYQDHIIYDEWPNKVKISINIFQPFF